jgi:hypothetical protein
MLNLLTGWEMLRGKSIMIYISEMSFQMASFFGRHEIRDCISKRDVGERMKVFKEFVSMFDDDK